MKRTGKKILAAALCAVLVVTSSAAAFGASDPSKVITRDWTDFRGNENNNAVVSDPVPTEAGEAALYWATKSGDGYGEGAIGSPILVDGYLYYNQGKTINKMDAVGGELVASGSMVERSNFSIIPPTYGDGMIFVGLANGRIQAFDAKTLESLWVYQDELKGQPNCPIIYHDGYVYTGFWNSETRDANFVCVSVKDEKPASATEAKKAKWTYTSKGGYYWAGAFVNDDFVLVGTDDGNDGYISQSSKLLCFKPKTGKLLDSVEGLNADIRSNVSYDEVTDRYYFTSKGGSFYSVKVSESGKISDLKELKLGGMSTSTPAVYNGRAYVGVSGSGQFDKYNGHRIAVIDLESFSIAYTASCMGYPQTSGLITTAYEKSEGYVYVYFFENMTPGKLRYIKDRPGQMSLLDGIKETASDGKTYDCAPVLFTPQGGQAQYAIASPICDEYGTIYFKNDSAHMMALGSKITYIEVITPPKKKVYDIGDTLDITGIKVEAHLANGLTRDISQYVIVSEFGLSEGQTDATIYYPYQLYNDAEQSDTLFTTIDIKVNSKAVSDKNNKAKAQIAAAKPKITSIKALGSGKAKLSWQKVGSADGYLIYRSLKKSSGFKSVKTITKGTTVSYTASGLTKGKTYYFKVRAYRTINGTKYYSKYSTVKSVKV